MTGAQGRLVLNEFDESTGVGHIRFNRPDVLNALDVPLARAFANAVADMTGREGLRCVVLSAAGRGFVAGGDVSRFAADLDAAHRVVAELLDALNPAVLALRACAAPVVAAVRGVAAGAGLSIVLGADLVVAGEDARFVMAYDKVGATPDCGGSWFMAHKLGRTRAMELMLLGDPVDAATARDIGLVNEVLPTDQVEPRALALAARIASGPTLAYGRFRSLLDGANHVDLAAQLAAERAAFLAATGTSDFREGVAAFRNRRSPTFRGR